MHDKNETLRDGMAGEIRIARKEHAQDRAENRGGHSSREWNQAVRLRACQNLRARIRGD